VLNAAPIGVSTVISGFGTIGAPMFCVIIKIDKALVRRWYGVISAQGEDQRHTLSKQVKYSYRWYTTTEARGSRQCQPSSGRLFSGSRVSTRYHRNR
jgi:hypothetical protein